MLPIAELWNHTLQFISMLSCWEAHLLCFADCCIVTTPQLIQLLGQLLFLLPVFGELHAVLRCLSLVACQEIGLLLLDCFQLIPNMLQLSVQFFHLS